MAAEVAGGIAGLVLLVALCIGLLSMLRRTRKFLTALRVANENRNRARSTSQSAARATAGVDFGGVHLHVPGGSGTTDHDDITALVRDLVELHRAGRVNDVDVAAALRGTSALGPGAVDARRLDARSGSVGLRAVGDDRHELLGPEHLA